MDLSLNLKGVVSQRLIPKIGGGRAAAIEIMLNSPKMADHIFKGEVHHIKETMAKSKEMGMRTFDQALFDLYDEGLIGYEDAMRNADSIGELKLAIKLNSSKKPEQGSGEPGKKLELKIQETASEETEGGPASFGQNDDSKEASAA